MIHLYASYFNILKLDTDVLKLFFTFKPWVSYALIDCNFRKYIMRLIYLMNIFQKTLFLIMFWNKRAKTERKTSTQEPALYKTYFKLHYMKKIIISEEQQMKRTIKTRNPKTKMTSRKTQVFSYDTVYGVTQKGLSSSSSSRGEVAVEKQKRLIIMFS